MIEKKEEEKSTDLRFIRTIKLLHGGSLLCASVTSSVVFTKVKSPPSAIVLLVPSLHVLVAAVEPSGETAARPGRYREQQAGV